MIIGDPSLRDLAVMGYMAFFVQVLTFLGLLVCAFTGIKFAIGTHLGILAVIVFFAVVRRAIDKRLDELL